MRHVDAYRNGEAARQIANRVCNTRIAREVTLMEVCGTHTMAVFRAGIRDLLPSNVRLLSGPGCPVCVTPNAYIDRAIAFARLPDTTIATFGDMLRVPGSSSSLEREKSMGHDVRIVYSALQAVELARSHPERNVVFLGVGFETTAPTVAASILEAKQRQISNYLVLCGHKVIPPPMAALVQDGELNLDGFICPGHVSAITGSKVYEFLARDHRIPCVVAGFEPVDILLGIEMLVQQIAEGRAEVENEYRRVVTREGNVKAQDIMHEVFEPVHAKWRGLGVIPDSGLRIRPKYRQHDAEAMLPVETEPTVEHKGCICGKILKGTRTPEQCPLFRTTCTPENPLGACMVSSEGTCAAYYRFATPSVRLAHS